MIDKILKFYDKAVEKCLKFDFLALLSIRLYLLPTIYVGAHSKVLGFSNTVIWFATPAAQGGLGLPFPTFFALLATATEVAGLICLTLGLFTRLISIPMMVVMSVASLTVHASHGWEAIAGKTTEASMRMTEFLVWLKEVFPGRYNYITELGDPVILNNGIEFSVTYFIMLLILFFYGGGRYVSVDYYLKKLFPRK